jgi:nucleoside-diphosphate-sugar epimerase
MDRGQLNGCIEMREMIIDLETPVLVTGASGFVGSAVVANLLEKGFRRVRCFVRPSSDRTRINSLVRRYGSRQIEVIQGNLTSRQDCLKATENCQVVYHLAAGTGEKSFPDAFLNSVVTTRNLLDASLENACLKRFVNVSSFAVYTNRDKPEGRFLDESCLIEERAELRGEAYCYAKVKQDQLVIEYGKQRGLRYVILRPGTVYGPGQETITGRVGIDTFGIYLHLGGSNTIPLTYVDNCAEAIVLAGMRDGIDGEIFNIVDDQLPSSRQFLRLYKRNLRSFRSIYLPHFVSFLLCYLWEKYSLWSNGQLPPVFNRRRWHAEWKRSRYSNSKLKQLVGWTPKVSTREGLARFFESCGNGGHA